MKTMIPVVVVKIKDNEPIEFYDAKIQVYGEYDDQVIYIKRDDMLEEGENFDTTLGIFKQRTIDYLYLRYMLNCQKYEGDLFNEKNI